MKVRQLEKQLNEDLKGPTKKAAYIARYTGGVGHEDREPDEVSQLIFLGHPLPVHRKVLDKYSKLTCSLGTLDEWQLWIDLWKRSRSYEIRSICLLWISRKKNKEIRFQRYGDLYNLVADVDNWALSDGLSSILAEILEEHPHRFAQYKKWNKSKNPWIRRQSLVGIYYYARLRKKHYSPKEVLDLLKNLLDDRHFYVQKSVGWTLREIDRVDSRLQRSFVARHLARISSVAWYATSELYPIELKRELVFRRREMRG